ncbi:hypothetical protein VNI00_004349 [Paramarasmius palmivorus]|uniref:Uncharacterized protein n=1 Tax=Paramarasmius palmivorus TaxID=297713 RepID=A0AAW0DP20_9AGAR
MTTVWIDSLLKHVSALTLAPDDDSDRRESYVTANSRPPSRPKSTLSDYADEAYDKLVQSVLLTPNGTHVALAHEDAAMASPSVPNQSQTPDTLPIAGPSEPLFQSFSPSSPLAPYAYKGPLPAFASPGASISIGTPSTSSQPTRSQSPKKEIQSNTGFVSGRSRLRNGVFIVLSDNNDEQAVYSTWAKANTARRYDKNISLLSYSTNEEAQQAIAGYVRSRLIIYLHDNAYENAWFTVLKGRQPTTCQRDGLLKAIGKDYLKELGPDDIVPAFTEEDAISIYHERNNMYED